MWIGQAPPSAAVQLENWLRGDESFPDAIARAATDAKNLVVHVIHSTVENAIDTAQLLNWAVQHEALHRNIAFPTLRGSIAGTLETLPQDAPMRQRLAPLADQVADIAMATMTVSGLRVSAPAGLRSVVHTLKNASRIAVREATASAEAVCARPAVAAAGARGASLGERAQLNFAVKRKPPGGGPIEPAAAGATAGAGLRKPPQVALVGDPYWDAALKERLKKWQGLDTQLSRLGHSNPQAQFPLEAGMRQAEQQIRTIQAGLNPVRQAGVRAEDWKVAAQDMVKEINAIRGRMAETADQLMMAKGPVRRYDARLRRLEGQLKEAEKRLADVGHPSTSVKIDKPVYKRDADKARLIESIQARVAELQEQQKRFDPQSSDYKTYERWIRPIVARLERLKSG